MNEVDDYAKQRIRRSFRINSICALALLFFIISNFFCFSSRDYLMGKNGEISLIFRLPSLGSRVDSRPLHRSLGTFSGSSVAKCTNEHQLIIVSAGEDDVKLAQYAVAFTCNKGAEKLNSLLTQDEFKFYYPYPLESYLCLGLMILCLGALYSFLYLTKDFLPLIYMNHKEPPF